MSLACLACVIFCAVFLLCHSRGCIHSWKWGEKKKEEEEWWTIGHSDFLKRKKEGTMGHFDFLSANADSGADIFKQTDNYTTRLLVLNA